MLEESHTKKAPGINAYKETAGWQHYFISLSLVLISKEKSKWSPQKYIFK